MSETHPATSDSGVYYDPYDFEIDARAVQARTSTVRGWESLPVLTSS